MVAFTAHLLGKEVAVYDVSCYGNQLIAKHVHNIHPFIGDDGFIAKRLSARF